MPESMSFLPEDYVERKLQRRTNVICFGLFCIVMSAVVAAYMVTDRQRQEVMAEQQRVANEFSDAAKRLEQLDDLQQRKARIVRKANVTGALVERIPRTNILSELVNNMPSSMTLLELSMDTKVIPASAQVKPMTALDAAKKDQARKKAGIDEPEIPETETILSIVGIAPTDSQVAEFMTAVAKRPLFQDVNLGFSEQVVFEQQRVRKFRVDIRLNNHVDPHKIAPLMVKRELPQNPMGDKLRVTPDGRITSTIQNVPIQPAASTSRD